MKKVVILALLAFSVLTVRAQVRGTCGNMPSPESDKRILASREMYNQIAWQRAGDLKYIPVKFHLIAKSDGTGRVSEFDVLKQMCTLNEDYADTDFRFYIKDASFSYKNSDAIYNSPRTSSIAHNQMLALKLANNNAVNVFVVNNIGSGSGGIGTVLGYYDSQGDWIVVIKGEVSGTTNTLSHEMGHFFSLEHTFYGWEGAPFDENSAGWPVAPFNSPNGPQTEKQDGSNCTVAADKICDTPPDYNFGLVWSNCNYAGGAQDPSGALVNPMENNQMSYFSGCYPYIFTEEQKNLMYGDYAKSYRDYIKSSYIPDTTEITQKPTQISPANNATGVPNVGVTLDWDDVPNASHYMVALSTSITFGGNNQYFITDQSQFTLPTLETDKNYYWKVTAFNDGWSCVTGLISPKWKFRTAPVAVSDIEEIRGWDITPNPSYGPVRLVLDMDRAVKIKVDLISTDGRLLHSQDLPVPAGSHYYTLSSDGLPNGIYLVRLRSNKGVETKRLVVSH